MNLDEIRTKIDELDKKIATLIAKRMHCSVKVAEIKKAEGSNIYKPQREEQVLNNVREYSAPYGEYVMGVYKSLMESSRELQYDTIGYDGSLRELINSAKNKEHSDKSDFSIACQGVNGAFSHHATLKLYPNANCKFYKTFEDVFKAVESGETEIGILPVENSTAGSVTEVYDLILKYRHYIVGAVDMKINQNLLSCKGASLDTIKKVYSHQQALMQCSNFIEEHKLIPIESENTASAAKMVAELNDPTIAAIGSVQAAQIYGLEVLCPCIQTSDYNSTRFITVSKKLAISKDSNKISLVFSLPHVTGSLYRILNQFALRGLNLTKIESRSAKTQGYQYLFYLDFIGNVFDEKTLNLLSILSAEMEDFSFLGNYKESKFETI